MIKTKRKANIFFKEKLAGLLEETEKGFRFTYDANFLDNKTPISISLQIRKEPYENTELFSFFEGLLPEGWYLDIVSTSLKIDKNDKFGLLLATCEDTIGAVKIVEE
ncbi:HipA N-terminal domain-containing protein [Candidatus Desantisbacteria bacterium]|nr:HipA N-terminal domain-containing protein [Candidatus Desantisbacteria bacterium]